MADGRRFVIIYVVDNCTRESLALPAHEALSNKRVATELVAIIA